MTNQETVYFQESGVTVTNARAILGNETYVVANITSVSAFETGPNRAIPLIIALVGLIIGLCSFSIGFRFSLGVIVGILIIAVAGYVFFTAKPSYVVRIKSASGEADAYMSKDKTLVERIATALNTAIVRRG